MKLRILTDNNILQSQNFLGEHGLSIYIEEGGKKILFDTGYSDVFLKNALKMGINLLDIDYIILSHGHYDHTWGLSHYLPFYVSNKKQGKDLSQVTVLTHPDTFKSKEADGLGEIGSLLSKEKLAKIFKMQFSKEPLWLSESLVFLGEIPRGNDFEGKEFIGEVFKNGVAEKDYIQEDSALVYKTKEGLVVVTGCSHSGICNIIEYAKKVCNDSRIVDVVGGFHLVKSSEERLRKTADYLSSLNLKYLHPCHCTDFRSRMFLSKTLKLDETGVGTVLNYESV